MIDIYKRVHYSQSMTYMVGLFVARGQGSRKVHFHRELLTSKEQIVHPRFVSSGRCSIKGILVTNKTMLRNCNGKLVNIVDTRCTVLSMKKKDWECRRAEAR